METLDALPEPIRSMFRDGSFSVGQEDDIWQVIPTAWVKAAQQRWSTESRHGAMESMGVDVARGGRDQTVLAARHGDWYAPLVAVPGAATPDGPAAAALVVSQLRDAAPVHVDVVGVGGSVYDHLKSNGLQTVAVNGGHGSVGRDRSGQLSFANKRAELYWKFRESLDPRFSSRIKLPPDRALLADLCAPRWKLTPAGIQIESKTGLVNDGFGSLAQRLGRSPDRADAVIYASICTPKHAALLAMRSSQAAPYNILEV